MSRLTAAVIKNLIVFSAAEAILRLLVLFGSLSLPPALTNEFDLTKVGRDPREEKRLYEADRDLVFGMRVDADLSYDRVAAYAGKPRTFRVHTNHHGYRTAQFSDRKRPGTFRIICLGDSSTFGFNIEESDAYPAVLSRLLDQRAPGRFEVLNLGVPGYSSRQGLELIRLKVLGFQPDLVTFAYGTNDRAWKRALSDDALIRLNQSAAGGAIITVRTGLDHVYAYRLLRRAMQWITYRFLDTGEAGNPGDPRVSLDGIRNNIADAHRLLAANGIGMIVLNNDFFGTDAREGITMGVKQTGVPFLDMQQAFLTARQQRSEQIAAGFNLPPATLKQGMTLLRVLAPGKQHVSVELWRGAGTPATEPMHDDGSDGDQMAGDGIWSHYVASSRVLYKYWERTAAGEVKEFLDNTPLSTWRQLTRTQVGVADIDVFGDASPYSDTSHPDEDGQQIIAHALFDSIAADPRVQQLLAAKR